MLGHSQVSPYRHEDINAAKKVLLNRLTERTLPPTLVGLQQQENQVYSLLEQSVSQGESNSLLLIGSSGSGKSALVQRILDRLSEQYRNTTEKAFFVVRLSGQIHTDDRIALRDIWEQLSYEQDLDEANPSSFFEAMEMVLRSLKEGSKDSSPIIFILDKFELFTEHSRQALLYNLFDIAQSKQNPIAVIGLTTHVDVVDKLEKRVRSRFSHRQILITPPNHFPDFYKIARNGLTLFDQDDVPEEYKVAFNRELQKLDEDNNFTKMVQHAYDLCGDIRYFYRLAISPVTKLSPAQPFLTSSAFLDSYNAIRIDSRIDVLKGLSILELCLIVAVKSLLEKCIPIFNFEMAFDEYKEFMLTTGQQGGMERFKKGPSLKAFERLQAIELLLPVESVAKCPKEYRMFRIALEPNQITELVKRYEDCPNSLKLWGTKWID
ncbi:origin recognition complex subunit 4 C-terminus-domain-containing protein [Paraphysoderma sedebokerense]|nr:origin recognition complex subunit 4 C-terminus-domain-containing protein [Paraphysoderma sedebokerense]